MTADLEFEGKNIEKAAKAASKKLEIPLEKLQYDVISYGSSGIFGLVGARKAKIRVLKKVLSKKGADKKKGRGPQPPKPMAESISGAAKATQEPEASVRINEGAIETARDGLQRILDAITEEAVIVSRTEEDRIFLEVSGGNSGVLIGKRGQTLEAIQYVVEKMTNARSEHRIRVHVDVEGYLRNRADHLEKMAARLAEKAKRNRKPASLGQLNPHDRKVVHLALKEDSAVRTQSLGNGYYRKLVIYPKKKGPQQKKDERPISEN